MVMSVFIFIFEAVFQGGSATLPYIWKIHYKIERHLCLVAHIITKLSQNVYLVNTHILIYRHVRCACKLWNEFWFYCAFWVFSYIFDDHSYLNCCISTKLSLMCNNQYYVKMLVVTASYGMPLNFCTFFT